LLSPSPAPPGAPPDSPPPAPIERGSERREESGEDAGLIPVVRVTCAARCSAERRRRRHRQGEGVRDLGIRANSCSGWSGTRGQHASTAQREAARPTHSDGQRQRPTRSQPRIASVLSA
jgi:hypothetical protein